MNSKIHKSVDISKMPKWRLTKKICLAAVQEDGMMLQYVPKRLINWDICLAAVQNNVEALQFVPNEILTEEIYLLGIEKGVRLHEIPEEKRTEKICLAIIEKTTEVDLTHVPKEVLTEEMCLLGIEKGVRLHEIPEEKRTEKIYLALIEKDPSIIRYLPNEILTEEMCLSGIEKGVRLHEIPEEKRTEKIYLALIEKDPSTIRYLPKEILTDEMYVLGIKKGVRLHEIPEEKRTKKIYLALIEKDPYRIDDVPKEVLTEEFLLLGIEKGVELWRIPEEKRTEKVCLAAIEKATKVILAHVPKEVLTEEMCLLGIEKGVRLHEIPEEKRTEKVYLALKKVCLDLIEKDPYGIDDVPKEVLTEEFLLLGIEKGVELWRIPEEKRTEKVCLAAIEQAKDTFNIYHVPKEVLTEEMCLLGIEKNVISLRDIPEEKRTEKVCLASIEKAPDIIGNRRTSVQNEKVPDFIRYIPDEVLTEEMCLLGIEKGVLLYHIPEEKRTEKVYLAAIKKNIVNFNAVPKEMLTEKFYILALKENKDIKEYIQEIDYTFDIAKEILKQDNPGIIEEEVFEHCKNFHPFVLYNSNKADEVYKMIEEKIGDNAKEKEKLNFMKRLSKVDKKYFQLLVDDFYYTRDGYDYNNNIRRVCSYETDAIVANAKKFESKGEIPSFEVVKYWTNAPEQYKYEEHKRLLEAGIIKESWDYRESLHNKWILNMYQILGCGMALKLLKNIPEVTPEMFSTMSKKNEIATNEVFEKRYKLSGEIGLSVEVINKIYKTNKNMSTKFFRELNNKLETDNNISIKDIALEYNLDQGEIKEIEDEVKRKINREKIAKIEGTLQEKLEQNVQYQRGRIHDLIIKVIKSKIENEEEITEVNLVNEVNIELNRKNETEEYVYSLVIRREEENIKIALKEFISQNEMKEILNNNIIKILKRSKEKIGEGWISKIIGISQEMKKEDYEKISKKLGIEELEHEEKIVLKATNEEGKKKAQKLLIHCNCAELLTFEKMETMFGGVCSPYSKRFGEFFSKYRHEIMNNEEYLIRFAEMHNGFDDMLEKNSNINKLYHDGGLKVQTVLDYILGNKFLHGKGEAELAKNAQGRIVSAYWEKAREVFKITSQREESSIPPVKSEGKKFRGRMLRVDEPLQLFVGNITKCCQVFGNVGEGAMLHAVTERNGGIFVIEEIDVKGKSLGVIAQSWVWRNNDVLCFDNIEVRGDNLTHEEQEEVLNIYRESAEEAIKIDNETLGEMCKKGEILKADYDNYVLKEVRIGLGCNQGMPIIEEKITNGELEKAYDVIKPKEAEKIYKIGTENKKPWVDSELSVIIARNENIKVKDKNAFSSKDVPVSYRKSRGTREEQGWQIDSDMIDAIKQIEAESYREEQQIMQRCETIEDIAYEYDCNVDDIKLCVSRDKDWYAMYYEEENSIYIADIALVNGTHAQKTDRKTETLIAGLELSKKMYEIFLEACESEKTVTCDATKDTSGINISAMIKNGLVEAIEESEYKWNNSDIEMKKMTLIPKKEKIEEELKEIEELIKKAEKRRRVYKGAER